MNDHQHLPSQPHPKTGEPWVSASITTESGAEVVHFTESEPQKPEAGWGYSDEDDVFHEFTEAELAYQQQRYEMLHAAWVKRGSPRGPQTQVIPGVSSTRGEFVTASGAKAEGVRLPDGTWRWTAWSDK